MTYRYDAQGEQISRWLSLDPIGNIDPLGLYQMCHRDLLIPLPYARHCYVRFEDGSTSSYDNSGVKPDRDPNQEGSMCTEPKEPEKDDCIKQAMKECGTLVPPTGWPNWPINLGPQPSEPGYSSSPVYDSTLGQ